MEKKKVIKFIIAIAVSAVAIIFIGGFLGDDIMFHIKNRGALGPLTREDIDYLNVDAPQATSKDGTVTAADWQETYPYIVASMGANKSNTYITDYLEQDPYLVNIYEGFGFAKEYGSARGHEYTLEDVNATARPHALANCLTCKTPNFTKLVNDLGVAAYTMDFNTVFASMEENVSCYNCHGNDAGNGGQIVITHSYVAKALGDNAKAIDPSTLSCGQCHIEYYFTTADKETMMPYDSVEAMTPEAILNYYDTMAMPDGSVGFYDWIQASTGTKLLKAQHPEMETYLLGKHAADLNCADCHMAIEMADDGTVYHSHLIQSPLENKNILATCVRCHGDTDMVSMVRRIQDRITDREIEIGNKLSGLKDALAAAVAGGKVPEATLDQVRKLYREAQWFFDFCYVENSEGAHNSELSTHCLDVSEERIQEALAILS